MAGAPIRKGHSKSQRFEIFDSKGFLGPSPAWRLPGSCCQCHSLRPKSQPGAARARRMRGHEGRMGPYGTIWDHMGPTGPMASRALFSLQDARAEPRGAAPGAGRYCAVTAGADFGHRGTGEACPANGALDTGPYLLARCMAHVRVMEIEDPMASLPPLTGVNAGGWLNLEDWFFSGVTGRNVMSLVNRGQGACLPPAVLTMDDYWPSEGFLTMRLNQSRGPAFTAEAFEAHRRSFIGEEDFQGMASLKLQLLRLPLHWAAFADALAPIDHELYGKHNPDEDTAIVPDPYYNGLAAFATVPRKWLASQLRKAAQNNLRVVLDLHAFPGGAANGTYNGVWPSPPAFWKEKSNVGNRSVALKDAGLMVVKAMVQWVEGLDDTARGAVAGVTVMNEPAHMNQGSAFASEADILQWLSDASNMFRQSKLPGMSVKLYMQLIGTAFRDFDGTVVPWFHKTFSSQEQSKWAVADLHFYIAWGGCDGRVISGGGFACDDPLDEIRQKIDGCVKSFTQDFRKNFGGLRAVTEFSTGTFQDARFACQDRRVLEAFLQVQADAYKAADIQPFFWTWRMPHGPIFERGWSLRWLAGLELPAQVTCPPPGHSF
ncbi:unnamed protein product [Effrenium voratum]|nr:unnamed protein product [Effrenium voratum]